MWLEILAALVLGALFIYSYLLHKRRYWSRRGVIGPRPTLLLGNSLARIKSSPVNLDPLWHRQYGSLYGVFNGLQPCLVVHEPPLIRQLLVTDFGSLPNRSKLRTFHELWNSNLIFSEGEQWRRVRRLTAPAFTGARIRRTCVGMQGAIERLERYLDNVILNQGGVVEHTQHVISGLTIDLVASTAFATDTDANGDRTSDNHFVTNGRKLFEFDSNRVAASFLLPKWILRVIGLKTFFDPDAFQFFIDYTRHLVKERQKAKPNAKRRNDLLQLLLDATDKGNSSIDDQKLAINEEEEPKSKSKRRKVYLVSSGTKEQKLTENEVIAQSIAFFVAGYETTASTLSHCLFELANNTPIQQRLCNEIERTVGDGKISLDSVQYIDLLSNECPYLDAVVRETLRHYPPLTRITRVVEAEGYQLDGIALDRGTSIDVPVYAIHHSDQYWAQPYHFDPERFMPSNREAITPFTFLPFGAGPRNCIGMRFALQTIKLAIAQLVTRYKFQPTEGTPDKLSFEHTGSPQLNSFPFPLAITFR